MTLIYILLTIIAIGVLLLSDEGKEILRSIWILPVIAGIGFVGFYLIIGGVAFFQTDSFKWFYENIFPWIFLTIMTSFGIYWLSKSLRNIIKNEIIKTWVEKRSYSVFVIILLSIIVLSFSLAAVFTLMPQ